MPASRLFNLRRWARCRQVFRGPWAAHVRLALSTRSPLKLEFRAGGTAHFAQPRRFRKVFDYLLAGADEPGTVTCADGLVQFEFRGERIALRPDTTDAYVFSEICLDDCYGLLASQEKLDTVVDLGANVGLFSAIVAPRAQRVIAVEPVAGNRAVAERNLARHLSSSRVKLVTAAVGPASGGTTRIHLSGNSGGHSIDPGHAAGWGPQGFEDVPAITLADLFTDYGIERCSLLKCDVEGAEYGIFAAAPLELLRRVERIVLEAHVDRQALLPSHLTALILKLREAGFAVADPLVDLRAAPRQALLLRAHRCELTLTRRSAA